MDFISQLLDAVPVGSVAILAAQAVMAVGIMVYATLMLATTKT